MTTVDALHPHDPALERFLYASVGEDRKGHVVTVLSAFARLKLDPWEEAEALSALDRTAAGTRLGLLLSRFRDVPALDRDHGSIARDLTVLLPRQPQRRLKRPGPSEEEAATRAPQAIWAIAAILLFVLQMMSVLSSGSIE